jgi:hypothetical protein
LTTIENVAERRSGSLEGSTARRTAVLVIAAAAPALLYLAYVVHYSVDAPWSDDWSIVTVVHSALHGRLSLSELWSQYTGTRLLVGRLVFVAFGFIDRLDEKSVILFSAGTFIGTYVLFLRLFRSYLGRRLPIASVFVLGMLWFSLVDEQNALWSFQLSWYLALFFFVVATYFLLEPLSRRNLCFGFAIVAAVAGSLSEVLGFVIWPVGLICLAWSRAWDRRTRYESVIWVAAAVITTAGYLPGYHTANDGCISPVGTICSTTFGLHHPAQLVRFFLLLVASVFPTSSLNWTTSPSHFGELELLGAAIIVVAALIVVQSGRERYRKGPTNPLAVLLIVFAVLVDFMFAISRVGEGLPSALQYGRYTMPNVILLVGIVVGAWAHLPNLRNRGTPMDRRRRLKLVGVAALALFLVAQLVLGTKSGVANGRLMRQTTESDARVMVNLDRIPIARRGCDLSFTVYNGALSPSDALFLLVSVRHFAMQDHLSLFQPGSKHALRAEGLPNIALCDHITMSALPDGSVGEPYSAALPAGGDGARDRWSLDPYHPAILVLGRPSSFDVLPNGLKLNTSTGVISGSPRARGTFTFFVNVGTTRSSSMTTRIFSIAVS